MEILHGLDLHVDSQEIVSLIGANGAGKTTTLRALAGVVTATGHRRLEGKPLQAASGPDRARRRGARRAGPRALRRLTSSENLEMGAYTQPRSSVRASLDQVFELFPILAERRTQKAETMSGGQQQMLAIGRALMARPRA